MYDFRFLVLKQKEHRMKISSKRIAISAAGVLKPSRPHASGLTVIEVLVAIALVLLIITTPHMAGIFWNVGFSTQAHEFLNTLNYARSEAIKRH